MSSLALFRKYRSQTFGDLVGQGHVVKTLQSGIQRGRIAQAYLFTGPRGTGKTSTARLLAKALNCEKGPAAEPCNECDACQSIASGNAMDVLELDAASESGVEKVRESIVEAVDYQPAYCRYRVFIIDEVHDLSKQAFDALLKTIEEPPAHVVFILATTEATKVPPTIRSRCQRFEFHRGSIQEIAERLRYVAEQEGFEIEPAAVGLLAKMADGGYRDALTLLEQVAVTADGPVTAGHVAEQLGLVGDDAADAMLRAMASADVPALVAGLDEAFRRGRDAGSVVESLLSRLADLTRAAYGLDSGGPRDATTDAATKATATEIGMPNLLRLRAGLAQAHTDVRDVSIPRIWLESELIRLTSDRTPAPKAEPVVAKREEPAPPTAKDPVAEAPPEPEPVVAPEPTGDPALDHAAAVWAKTKGDWSGDVKLMAMKLAQTRIARVEGDVAYVEFARQVDYDYVNDRLKAQEAVRAKWAANGGEGMRLVFVAAVSAPVRGAVVETTQVESPLRGEQLAQAAREVFGQQES